MFYAGSALAPTTLTDFEHLTVCPLIENSKQKSLCVKLIIKIVFDVLVCGSALYLFSVSMRCWERENNFSLEPSVVESRSEKTKTI